MTTSYTSADIERGVVPIGLDGATRTMEAPFTFNGVLVTFRECAVDFAGSQTDPPISVDVFDSPRGSLLRLAGNWHHYGASPPAVITDADATFAPFLAACIAGDESGLARRNLPKHGSCT